MNRPVALLCLFCLAAAAGLPRLDAQESLARWPYLGATTDRSVIIAWRTVGASDGAVEYSEDESFSSRAVDRREPRTDHFVLIEGLEPSRVYRYRVLAGGQAIHEGATFRTIPPAGSEDPWRFVAVGDTGTASAAQLDVAARLLASEPRIALHAGDLTYPGGSPGELDEKYFQVYRDLLASVPVYLALGNKDVQFDGGAEYLDSFHLPENGDDAERYYSFVHANALFIALDSNQSLAPGDPQYDWLEAQLSAAFAQVWKIVFFHHPAYSSTGGTPALRESLAPLFDQHRVDLVIQAHNHYYERTYPIAGGEPLGKAEDPDYRSPRGTVYLVTGGGGGVLASADPQPFTARYESTYHHVKVDITGGQLRLEAIDRTGAVFDRMSITKEAPSFPFKRGDTDADGTVDLTDPVLLLGYLFLGGSDPVCFDAADADDSGDLGLTDAIVSLGWQFLGERELPEPGPYACGLDHTLTDPPQVCRYPPASCR